MMLHQQSPRQRALGKILAFHSRLFDNSGIGEPDYS